MKTNGRMSWRITIAALFVCLLLAGVFFVQQQGKPAADIAYGVNVLENGDFEKKTKEGLPVSWETGAYLEALGVSAFESARGREGQGVQIINHELNDARFLQTVKVHPNTFYCLEGDISAACSQGRGANLSVADVYSFTEAVFEASDAWESVKLYGKTGKKQTELTVFVRLGGYSGESIGTARFDNIKLYPVKAVPEGFSADQWEKVETSDEGKEEAKEQKNLTWIYLTLLALAYAVLTGVLARLVEKKQAESLSEEHSPALQVAMLLLFALLSRLLVASLIPGYGVDIGCFTAWANRMATVGPVEFYHTDMHADYPPGYMLVLWGIGAFGRVLGTGVTEALVKLPPILCDVATVYLIYIFAKTKLTPKASLLLALLYAVNPVTYLTGAAWGQVDSMTAILILLVVFSASRSAWQYALPLYVAAVLMKPQALMFGPLGAVALLMDLIVRSDREKRIRALKGIFFAAVTALLIVIPFSLKDRSFDWLIKLYSGTMTFYHHATVNATNLYFLFDLNWVDTATTASLPLKIVAGLAILLPFVVYLWQKRKNQPLFQAQKFYLGAWLCAALLPMAAIFMPLSISTLGTLLMGSVFVTISLQYMRRGDIHLLPLFGAMMLMAFSIAGTMMHERYMFPALLLLLVAYIYRRDRRLLVLLITLSTLLLLNVGVVLERAVRIGGSSGHLNAPSFGIASDTALLEYLLSGLSLLLLLYSLHCGYAMSDPDETIKTIKALGDRGEETESGPLTDLDTPYESGRMYKADRWIVLSVTLLYALIAFYQLGAVKAPQKPWTATTEENTALIDLKENRSFKILYYGGIHWRNSDFDIDISSDLKNWQTYPAQMVSGNCFKWQYHCSSSGEEPFTFTSEALTHKGRYIRVHSKTSGLTLMEMVIRDADTSERIEPTLIGDLGRELLDEQDTLEGEPGWYNSTYFDEIYHARTAYEQLNALQGKQPSSIYETTHPPLGKLFMTFSLMVFGMTPFGWRFAGTLAGVLMLPGMYLLGRMLSKRRFVAVMAMVLMAADCMHFAQTRIATIDSFVTLFIIWSAHFMLRYISLDYYALPFKKSLRPLFLSGLMMGLGIASKWTGCYAGVGLALVFFWSLFKRIRQGMEAEKKLQEDPQASPPIQKAANEWRKRTVWTLLWCLVFFVLIPMLIYYASFYPVFVATPGGLTIHKVLSANESMLSYHGKPGLGMDHPYYSPWYKWPISQKPMWYYSSARVQGTGSTIFAFGNPAVWWGGLLALALILARTLLKTVKGHLTPNENSLKRSRGVLLLVFFAAQYLPWVLVPRGTYIYHYFPAVPFIILSTAYCFDLLADRMEKKTRMLATIYLVVAVVLFAGFYPYVSGARVSMQWLDMMKWFPGIWY